MESLVFLFNLIFFFHLSGVQSSDKVKKGFVDEIGLPGTLFPFEHGATVFSYKRVIYQHKRASKEPTIKKVEGEGGLYFPSTPSRLPLERY